MMKSLNAAVKSAPVKPPGPPKAEPATPPRSSPPRQSRPEPVQPSKDTALPSAAVLGGSSPTPLNSLAVAPTTSDVLLDTPSDLERLRDAPRPQDAGVLVNDLRLLSPRPDALLSGDELNRIDTPIIAQALASFSAGDFTDGLDLALNSEGDRLSLTLGAGVSVPVYPGFSVSPSAELGVQVLQTADGYEVSISAEAAASAGLQVSDALNGGREAEADVRIIYHFDTLEEAAGGLVDLGITAGNNPLGDEVASTFELSSNVTDFLFNNPFTDNVGDFIGQFPGPAGDAFDSAQSNIRASAIAVEAFNDIADSARDRLNEARVGFEVTGTTGVDLNLGLPEGIALSPDLDFGVSSDRVYTARVNTDGSVSIRYALVGSGTIELGNFGIDTASSTRPSVAVSQNFIPDDDGSGLVRDGDAHITFSVDLSNTGSIGPGIELTSGNGLQASYAFEASDLGGNVGDSIQHFLLGEPAEAIDALGSIEGDLTLQDRVTSGVDIGVDSTYNGTGFNVSGSLTATDVDDAVQVEDLSLGQALDLIQTTVSGIVFN